MAKGDEQILVVPRQVVISKSWYGIKDKGIENFEQLVRENSQFKRRGDMETNSNFKQIIPYMVFKHTNEYFLMQRLAQANEERLSNKYSLGIGGHINEVDLVEGSILDWARREFDEEVDYAGTFSARPLGLLNDDNGVGQVHLGYLVLLEGDSDQIKVRDEHQLGRLATLEEIKSQYEGMETWSQIVYDFLCDTV
jgi:predicted NUDIX family phosphoesterase